MFAISSIGRKLIEKLRKRAYRHAYLAEHVRRGIAYQIRALRVQRGCSQGKLSKLLGKPQSVVCRLEDPSYGKVSVQTLLEVANIYDVALEVRFVPYSLFVQRTRDVSPASIQVTEFKDEFAIGFIKPIVLENVSADQDHSIQSDWWAAAGTGRFLFAETLKSSQFAGSEIHVN